MKKTFFIILLISVSNINVFGQSDSWEQFKYIQPNVKAIEDDGNFLWASGGEGNGIVKIDKISGEATSYNARNSKLPECSVNSIAIDQKGVIWLGTATIGLIKFDEPNCTTYNTVNSNLPDNQILSISIDSNDVKWLGTIAGLAKFNNKKWKIYNTSNSDIAYNVIKSLAIDAAQNIWIGTSGGGLSRFDRQEWTTLNVFNSGLPYNFIQSVSIDRRDNKWIGTQGGGLVKYDGNTWTVYRKANSGLPSDEISAVSVDRNENIWIGSDKGIAHFDGVLFRKYNVNNGSLLSDQIFSIYVDERNFIWTGTRAGMSSFDQEQWRHHKTVKSGLPNNHCNVMATDVHGNKWIGTQGGGLAMFDGENWQIFNKNNSPLLSLNITAIAFDDSNYVWVGTDGGGIGRYARKTWRIFDTTNAVLRDNSITSLFIDNQNLIWAGFKNSGLGRYDGLNWTYFNTSNSCIPSNSISSITEDSEGVKYIGTTDVGLIKFFENSCIVYDASHEAIESNHINSISISRDGTTWAVTSNGLFSLKESTVTNYNEQLSVHRNTLRSSVMDQNGLLWLGTNNGQILSYNGFNFVTKDLNIKASVKNTVLSLSLDHLNNKWIGTAKEGIYIYKESSSEISPIYSLFEFYGQLVGNQMTDTSLEQECQIPIYDKLFLKNNNSGQSSTARATVQKTATFAGKPLSKFRISMDTLRLQMFEQTDRRHLSRIYNSSGFKIQYKYDDMSQWETILQSGDITFYINDSCPKQRSGYMSGTIESGSEPLLREFGTLSKNNSFILRVSFGETREIMESNEQPIMISFFPSQKEISIQSKSIPAPGIPVEFKNSNTLLNFDYYSSTNGKKPQSTISYTKDSIVVAPANTKIATLFNNAYWNINSNVDSFNVNVCFDIDTANFNTNNFDLLNVSYQSHPGSEWKLFDSVPNIVDNKICFVANHFSNWAIALSKPVDSEDDIDECAFFNQSKSSKYHNCTSKGLTLSELLNSGKRDTISTAFFSINPGGRKPAGITKILPVLWEVKTRKKIPRKIKIDITSVLGSEKKGLERILFRNDALSSWKEVPFTRAIRRGREELCSSIQTQNGQFTLATSASQKKIYDCKLKNIEAVENEKIQFLSQIVNGRGPYIYAWKSDGNYKSGRSAPEHSFKKTGDYFYSLIVTDANGASAQCGAKVKITPAVLGRTTSSDNSENKTNNVDPHRKIEVTQTGVQWNKQVVTKQPVIKKSKSK